MKQEEISSIRIKNVTPNTEYAFQVAAADLNGTGTFGEPITLGGNYIINKFLDTCSVSVLLLIWCFLF